MAARPYQSTLIGDVQAAWAAAFRVVLMRLDTGGGKTFILASLVAGWLGGVAVIAHRHELVSQLSLTLARFGIVHNIIASEKVRRQIISAHIRATGRSWFAPGSRVAVASVDTLARAKGLEWWWPQVTLWVVDEGHHVVQDNKWHNAIKKFTNPAVHGLLPTATPTRADGKGLGSHADGVADIMVEGPPMRWLIEQGYLTDYRIVCPESDLAILEDVGASGDWSNKQLKEASERSHIVGDVVREYLRYARGKIGVTFTTDVDTAEKMVAQFRAAGVRAEMLTGDTDPGYRVQILTDLEARRLDMIVAIDVISEGLDLPALEVVLFARMTASLQVYMQQFGRVLRPIWAPGGGYDLETQAGRLASIAASCKPKALVLDFAGNTLRHLGPPDRPRVWTLDRRGKRGGGGGGIPLRTCGTGWSREALNALGHAPGSGTPCYQPYPRTDLECPFCGLGLPEPTARTSPQAVDGDLFELDPETLARLRGEATAAALSAEDYGRWLAAKRVPAMAQAAGVKHHKEAQEARAVLAQAMAEFVGRQLAKGLRDRQIHKAFFLTFGVDVLSAQSLNRADAETLTERVKSHV